MLQNNVEYIFDQPRLMLHPRPSKWQFSGFESFRILSLVTGNTDRSVSAEDGTLYLLLLILMTRFSTKITEAQAGRDIYTRPQ